jgi:uncharacterized membrane protein
MPSIRHRREAQARADRIRAFRDELRELENASILQLQPDQRAQVDAHHESILGALGRQFDIDATDARKKVSWGMRIASSLGAIALCAALYLFLQRIWGLLVIPVQVVILISAPLVFLALAKIASKRERTPYFTFLLSTISVAAFVLNLSMMGEMFNLVPSPWALLAWGLYAILLAYRFHLKLLLAGGLTSVVCFAAGTFTSWFGLDWLTFGERPENFLLAGLVLPALAKYPRHVRDSEFAAVYRILGLTLLLLPILLLSFSGVPTYLPFFPETIETIYETFGFLVSVLIIWVSIRGGFTAGVNIAASFFVILLYSKLYDWWWDWLPGYVFFLLIGLIAILLVAVFKRIRDRMPELESA